MLSVASLWLLSVVQRRWGGGRLLRGRALVPAHLAASPENDRKDPENEICGTKPLDKDRCLELVSV